MGEEELATRLFASRTEWEKWLAKQPADAAGTWLKLPKKTARNPSVTKAEAVEAALCYGWIDGHIRPFDEDWFLTRFTPRRARSKWSQINRKTAERLIKERRMRAAGQREVDRAKKDGRWKAAYAGQRTATIPKDLAAALRANPTAAAFFKTLDSANRYAILYRLHEAKRPETRAKRIDKFIGMLARHERIHET